MLDLSVITPVYNESSNVRELYERLTAALTSLNMSYEIIFMDDGSTDDTLHILRELHKEDAHVKVLSFSRNFGHQISLTAGLEYATGRAVISIDSDLQDDPADIPKFVEKWKEGYDGVYAVRIRRNESFIRTFFFNSFYKVFNKLSQTSIPLNAGDFCLLDRKIVDALNKLPERNRFLRGLRTWVGFKYTGIPQIRPARKSGSIKNGIHKLFRIGFDGIFSFSYLPLRLASLLGSLVLLFSFFFGLHILYEKFFTSRPIIGWTSLMVTIIFFSGVIILFLGLIGEYLCRIYDETKSRPLYFVKETLDADHVRP